MSKFVSNVETNFVAYSEQQNWSPAEKHHDLIIDWHLDRYIHSKSAYHWKENQTCSNKFMNKAGCQAGDITNCRTNFEDHLLCINCEVDENYRPNFDTYLSCTHYRTNIECTLCANCCEDENEYHDGYLYTLCVYKSQVLLGKFAIKQTKMEDSFDVCCAMRFLVQTMNQKYLPVLRVMIIQVYFDESRSCTVYYLPIFLGLCIQHTQGW